MWTNSFRLSVRRYTIHGASYEYEVVDSSIIRNILTCTAVYLKHVPSIGKRQSLPCRWKTESCPSWYSLVTSALVHAQIVHVPQHLYMGKWISCARKTRRVLRHHYTAALDRENGNGKWMVCRRAEASGKSLDLGIRGPFHRNWPNGRLFPQNVFRKVQEDYTHRCKWKDLRSTHSEVGPGEVRRARRGNSKP